MATLTMTGHDALVDDLYDRARNVNRDAAVILKAVSLHVMRGVKADMPVDKGRARASWGEWTPTDLRAADSGSSAADAIYEESATEITQGSNLPYIERLNAGHSKQAPAGFLDRRQAEGEKMLEAAVGALADVGSGLGGSSSSSASVKSATKQGNKSGRIDLRYRTGRRS